VNGFEALAGALSDLADSAEDAVAGGGSAHAAVQQATERARQIAWTAAMAARGRITPDDVAQWLGRDKGDGETLMMGRPAAKPSGRHRGRAWQAVRQWLGRAWGDLGN
jgi:hypothetical protein